MKKDLSKALENTDMVYKDLVEIANEIIISCTKNADDVIQEIKLKGIENLTNDDIRNSMLKIATISYSFSEIKEKSLLKAECAEILKKEKYASKFNETDGAMAFRENTALIDCSDETLVEAIYNLVASLLKTKQDELHRVVDVLKTVTMSRMSEARISIQTNIGSNPFEE